MEEGFIPLGRSFFGHYLWSEERDYSRAEAWLDLVQLGAYSPHTRMVGGVLFKVPRGGIVASERFLSGRWKWSRTKVRAFLELLRSDGMISCKKDQETTIINLSNYERYNPAGTAERPEKDQGKTTEEPPKDQREEGKERKESSPSRVREDADILTLARSTFTCPEILAEIPAWIEHCREHARERGKAFSLYTVRVQFQELARLGDAKALVRIRTSAAAGSARLIDPQEARFGTANDSGHPAAKSKTNLNPKRCV